MLQPRHHLPVNTAAPALALPACRPCAAQEYAAGAAESAKQNVLSTAKDAESMAGEAKERAEEFIGERCVALCLMCMLGVLDVLSQHSSFLGTPQALHFSCSTPKQAAPAAAAAHHVPPCCRGEAAQEMRDRASETAQQVGNRASEAAQQVGNRAGEAMDSAKHSTQVGRSPSRATAGRHALHLIAQASVVHPCRAAPLNNSLPPPSCCRALLARPRSAPPRPASPCAASLRAPRSPPR